MKLWIATYVDISDTSDSKPRVLAACKSRSEAEAAVLDDIGNWVDSHDRLSTKIDFLKMRVWSEVKDESCEWSIDEVEVET